MAIYSRNGAPVEIVTAREVPVWVVRKPGRIDWEYAEPKPRRGHKVELIHVTHVTAKQVGPYPDGSGVKSIGEMIRDGEEFPESDLRADDGAREIGETCRALMNT